ncbi:MAG: hypothetical protein H6Q64_2300 [Firmicutes bacterium]|nr:hypothetical protein [Bacillota bacterium]
MYYRFEPDIYATSSITKEPALPGFGTSFITGSLINAKIDTPMVFQSNFTRDDPPKSYVGLSIPVWSKELVELFRYNGVDNFECFEAIIRTKEPGIEWTGYFAVNIVGLVAAANKLKSNFTEILTSPSGVPLAAFHELVLNGKEVHSFDLFRLAESTSTIIVSEKVINILGNNPRSGGWGISAIEVEEN